jgi:predicted ArsR family transcriptional regulator
MFDELDRVLHQPIRTRIIAYLLSKDGADFSEIKTALGLSDGHMTTHMRELLASEYVAAHKTTLHGKSNTKYTVTQAGKDAFKAYINTLKRIIEFE